MGVGLDKRLSGARSAEGRLSKWGKELVRSKLPKRGETIVKGDYPLRARELQYCITWFNDCVFYFQW